MFRHLLGGLAVVAGSAFPALAQVPSYTQPPAPAGPTMLLPLTTKSTPNNGVPTANASPTPAYVSRAADLGSPVPMPEAGPVIPSIPSYTPSTPPAAQPMLLPILPKAVAGNAVPTPSSFSTPTPASVPSRAVELGPPIIDMAAASQVPTIPSPMPNAFLGPSRADLGPAPDGLFCPGDLDSNCAGCGPCGPPGRVWMGAEWLYWVTSGQSLPALVTTSPADTSRASAGVLGQPGTTILSGNQRVNNDWRNGFRTYGGVWLDPDQTFGLDSDFFFLGNSQQQYAIASNGSTILTRPFYNASLGRQDAELVSYPGIVAGRVVVDPKNSVIGGGVNAVCNLCCDSCGRVDALLGYRYMNLSDSVSIAEDLTALPGSGPVVPAGATYGIRDTFRTSNNFNGGVIGLAAERRYDRFFFNVRASVALGNNNEVTQINGQTTITQPGGLSTTYPGGLLAQATNIGHYTHNAFAVMPELTLRAGMQVTQNIRVFAGYNFIYLSNVVRAGDQINLAVNTSLLPPTTGVSGTLAPLYNRQTTDFWMQGVMVGAEVRF